MNTTIKFKAERIKVIQQDVRSEIAVARDIVRFLRDDCTARQNQSALLMYLEKRLTNTLSPLDAIMKNAHDISEYDPNEPEDLPF